ncbi:MAG: hypothetical protein ACRECJ_08920, partial [Limisphaerales bacterium]
MDEKILRIGAYTLIPVLLSQVLVTGSAEGKRHDEALLGHESPHTHQESRGAPQMDMNGRISGFTT